MCLATSPVSISIDNEVKVGQASACTRMTLLAFFPALSILFGAYGGDAGGCCLAPASGHNYFHQSEGGSDGFLP
jgi:hypothetical protein